LVILQDGKEGGGGGEREREKGGREKEKERKEVREGEGEGEGKGFNYSMINEHSDLYCELNYIRYIKNLLKENL